MRRPDSTFASRIVLPVFLAGLALATLGVAGCSDRETWTANKTSLTVPLPPASQFAALASRAITLSDRAQVVGGHLGVAAGATGALTVGQDARGGVGRVLL